MQNQALNGDFSGATTVVIPPAQFTQTPRPRGEEAFASLKKAPGPPATQTGRWRIWTLGFGGYRSLDGDASVGSSSQTTRNYGGSLGFDYQIAPDLLLGFSAGGSDTSISVPNLATRGSITAGHLGVYGLKTWGSLYGAAAVSYARLDNSTTRIITGAGPTEIVRGRFASDQVSARLELGWKRAFAHFTLTPFVAIEPAAFWARGYQESSTTENGGGGVLGLAFAARTTVSVPTFVGLQADTRLVLRNGSILTPYARLSWVHEFLPDRAVTATFINVPASTFSVDGARAASDAARLDAGAKYAIDTSRSFFANVSGEWSNVGHSYAATGGFRLVH